LDRYLLAENGTNREFKPVPGTRQSHPRIRLDQSAKRDRVLESQRWPPSRIHVEHPTYFFNNKEEVTGNLKTQPLRQAPNALVKEKPQYDRCGHLTNRPAITAIINYLYAQDGASPRNASIPFQL